MTAATERRAFAPSRLLMLVALAFLLAGCGGMAKLGGLFSDTGSGSLGGPLPPHNLVRLPPVG